MTATAATAADAIRARLLVHRELPPPAVRRQLRENANLPQEDIAKAVGVTRGCISHWEAGIREPKGQLLDRYVEVLQALREAA